MKHKALSILGAVILSFLSFYYSLAVLSYANKDNFRNLLDRQTSFFTEVVKQETLGADIQKIGSGPLYSPKDDLRIYEDENTEVFEYSKFGLSVIKLKRPAFSFIYVKKDPKIFSELASENDCSYAINSSFFAGTYQEAYPAGLLNLWGENYSPIAGDRQLTHVLRYNKTSGTAEIHQAHTFDQKLEKDILEFQTGPLVTDNNKVVTGSINASYNGSQNHQRTLLAILGDEIHLITVREEISLDLLGYYLLSLPYYKNMDVQVLNLDGGNSTAFYSKAFSNLNFNTSAQLPLLLCVKNY
jgi:exopolysaccharide biosynthesis protein